MRYQISIFSTNLTDRSVPFSPIMSFWPNNPFPQMGPQGVVSMDPEVALEVQREVTRRMAESARADFVAYVDKVRERTVLLTMKRDLQAEEAPKAKFADQFMDFLDAIESGDPETLRRFDEKEMQNTILTMMDCDAGDEGRLGCFYGDEVSKLGLGPLGVEEKVVMDAIGASSGGEKGGFSGGEYERVGAMVDAVEKPNGDGDGAGRVAAVMETAARKSHGGFY
ncbi:uncharacterized protein LOC120133599 [Hibiscus syriacus]|uniref:uncharacterized protein LOC120133599 n=1 Tax=Hibiscus syriacus TaxID=106335 RepID=UPI0019223024|nr:uncharacterized protein LOC120133599 [Hibiscus syriacus]